MVDGRWKVRIQHTVVRIQEIKHGWFFVGVVIGWVVRYYCKRYFFRGSNIKIRSSYE